MLTVISPAKRLDFKTDPLSQPATEPAFAKEALTLCKAARKLDVTGLQDLMKISENLARQNHDRFRAFLQDPSKEDTKAAVLAFAGDTYTGLEAATLDPDEMSYAQDHLRILSGLYGVLRPLDRIQPYRLEMGSRLRTARAASLYEFWGDKLALALNEAAEKTGAKAILNCASVEYFSAVKPEALKLPVISPVFLNEKNGEARIVSFFAKKARGAMARFVIQNRIVDAEALRDFDTGGYRYQQDMSEPQRPVFLASEQAVQDT